MANILFLTFVCSSGALRIPETQDNAPPTDVFFYQNPNLESLYSMRHDSTPENISIPHWMVGQSLVLIGDSNDRYAMIAFCDAYGAPMQEKDSTPNFHTHDPDNNGLTRMKWCTIPTYDLHLTFFFHFGVLTIDPQPIWHASALQDDEFRKQFLPTDLQNRTIHSSNDIVLHLQEAMPREIANMSHIYITQSSLWDSLLAFEFLQKTSRPISVEQDGLHNEGWDNARNGLYAWRWVEHVESYLEVLIRETHHSAIVWRSNPNCPTEDTRGKEESRFLADVHKRMAEEISSAVATDKGVWKSIRYADWRSHETAVGHCNGVHYTAYRPYWNAVWEALGTQGLGSS